jgi:hypothetical protein
MSTHKTKRPTIEISNRFAKLGPQLGMPSEKHGDEVVARATISVAEIKLSADEMDEIFPGWSGAHFDRRKNETVPAWPEFEPPAFTGRFEDAVVTLRPGFNGAGRAIELEDCKLKSLVFTPVYGGDVMLSMTVLAPCPKNATDWYALKDQLRGECWISVAGATLEDQEAKKAQQDLPLSSHVEGEEPEEKARKSRRGADRALAH